MRVSTIWCVAGASVLAATPLAGQLVDDGSFEVPAASVGGYRAFNVGETFEGWAVVGASGNVALVSGGSTFGAIALPAQYGAQWLDLTGAGSNAANGVEQQIATVPGRVYQLSFWVGNVVDPSGTLGNTSTVDVFVDGVALAPATNTGGAGTNSLTWQRFTRSFTAARASTTLTFRNGDAPSDNSNGIDNVALTAATTTVPEPGPAALVAAGLGGVLVAARRGPRSEPRR